jgi:hypothetical protein
LVLSIRVVVRVTISPIESATILKDDKEIDSHLNRGSQSSFTTLSTQTEIVSVVRMDPPSSTSRVGKDISSGYVGQDTFRGRCGVITTTTGFVSDRPGCILVLMVIR